MGRSLAVAALVAASIAAHASSPGAAWADEGDPAGAINPDGDAQGGPIESTADTYADTDPSALTDFQTTLDPHGAWTDDPVYGTVWTPTPDEVGADFTPYVTGGHWAYDDDYVWTSDYSWGWAAFHYGRWVWLRDRGWAWIPGRLYANAWVVWRVGDTGDDSTSYVGWAPAPATWGWSDGVAGLLGFTSPTPFVFCPARDVFAPHVAPRILSGPPAAGVMARSRPYVKAAPTVGPPSMPSSGPPPTSLGLESSRVTRAVRSDPSLLRARQFARPSTAVVLGARGPVPHLVRPRLVARPYAPAAGVPRSIRRK